MKLSHFFIDRPRFAIVVSIIITLIGAIAYFTLPVAQYPDIAPPTVVVTASYPGASSDVIAKTVATPLEQEINGVERMLYMSSQSTSDGRLSITISFELGTNLDTAQVLVQNRVALAEPRLPEEVRRIGVTTEKSSPDLLMVVHMLSPNGERDQLYLSNYSLRNVRDELRRLDGVGDVPLFGAREYSMRVWLDPARLAFLDLTASDIVAALRAQNIQVAAGIIGQQPMDRPGAFQVNVNALGRLEDESQFENIIVKTGENGRVVRLKDVARIELGALDYGVNSYLGETNAVAMPIRQRPGSNALSTAKGVREAMKRLSKDFPSGVEYRVVYDPTRFIEQSIRAVLHTILEAVVLVVVVILVFLQSWRVAIIPLLAIPVSLIGTFAAMAGFGYSLNNLSLFGLVLAIGIVVDDAIVVVENIERNIALGLKPLAAAKRAMDEVGSAIIATTLVLAAVFVPTAIFPGISGQFYRQFALTVTVSTIISSVVSLTLSPALAAILMRPEGARKDWFGRVLDGLLGWFFRFFNHQFDRGSHLYTRLVKRAIRYSIITLLIYGGFMAITWLGFRNVPTGFIPPQDQGYAIIAVQLPEGASLTRTDAVIKNVAETASTVPGVLDAVSFAGFNGATFSNASNAGVVFTPFLSFEERIQKGLSGDKIIGELRQKLADIDEAFVIVIPPPPVRGLGSGGGFKMMLQDRAGLGYAALEQAAFNMMFASATVPQVTQVFTPFRASSPQYFVDVDRVKAQMLDIPVENIFSTMEVFLGSTFVNEFNLLGRTYRVVAQAESQFRDEAEDISDLETRNRHGDRVPLGTIVEVESITGPNRVLRYNLYNAADLSGDTATGFSSGEALDAMEKLAAKVLPDGIDFEWTDIAYQEKQAGNVGLLVFPLAILFVFLFLTAQYESWTLPIVVILTVPICLFGAIMGVWFRGMDNNILTQIGFVVLVGLASKNAILIVDFARQREAIGKGVYEAAVEAAHLRLRPIIMTSFAFILGVLPMVIAQGPGAEMRQALGTTVFFGMLSVTLIGVFLAPVFYVMVRNRLTRKPSETGL